MADLVTIATPLNRPTYTYLDINSHFNGANGILVADIQAINTQLFNILSIADGEVDYEPTLFGMMDYFLFEPNNSTTLDRAYVTMANAVSQWLSSRIVVTPSSFTAQMDSANRRIILTVTYYYKALQVNVRTVIAIPFTSN